MKKIITRLFLTLITTLSCLGMQEPYGSNSVIGRYETPLKSAVVDKNIPLLYALTAASKNTAESGNALASLSSLPDNPDSRPFPYHHPGLPIKLYKDLASYLCPACNERDMAHALNAATHASYEKTQFLLQNFSQRLQPDILEEVMGNFLTNNPLYIPLYKTENEKNAATFQTLINAGAELSPANASLALQTLMRYGPAYTKLLKRETLMCCLNGAALECCYPERRVLMRLLKQKGAHFNCTGDESCGAYCDGLFAGTHMPQIRDINHYLVNDRPDFAACALCFLCGIASGTNPCLLKSYCMTLKASCCLIGAAQCMPDTQASHMYKAALKKAPHAIPMDLEPAPQPVLLANN